MLDIGATHRAAWLQLVAQYLGAISAHALMAARDEDMRLGAIHANDGTRLVPWLAHVQAAPAWRRGMTPPACVRRLARLLVPPPSFFGAGANGPRPVTAATLRWHLAAAIVVDQVAHAEVEEAEDEQPEQHEQRQRRPRVEGTFRQAIECDGHGLLHAEKVGHACEPVVGHGCMQGRARAS